MLRKIVVIERKASIRQNNCLDPDLTLLGSTTGVPGLDEVVRLESTQFRYHYTTPNVDRTPKNKFKNIAIM